MRRTPFLTILGLAVVAMVPSAPAAGQQTCELGHGEGDCTTEVTAVVLSVGILTLGPLPASILVDEAALESSFAEAVTQTYDLSSNVEWTLSLHANGPTWEGPTGTSKPIEDLLWSSDGTPGSFTAVNSIAAEIAAGSPTGREVGMIQFLSRWFWEDPPGDYGATILLTFSGP